MPGVPEDGVLSSILASDEAAVGADFAL